MSSSTRSTQHNEVQPQERLTRLHVNLNRPTATALKEVAEQRDLSVTEAVRQAIGTYRWFDQALRRGARVQLVEPDGQVREVIPII